MALSRRPIVDKGLRLRPAVVWETDDCPLTSTVPAGGQRRPGGSAWHVPTTSGSVARAAIRSRRWI